ncbi:MAG TPA: 4-hydroxythreonine-4-phosphate dehydrogenase PdxA [Pirellulaceae bacterium]|nr:4-hydroxythreonine-4-phosphate dehydrogenase PdxA [Pirellulaceae bacterium]
MTRPTIAVTMGDPAGIGPEVCLRLLADPIVTTACTPIVFGDAAVLRRVARRCNLWMPERILRHDQWPPTSSNDLGPGIYDLQAIDANSVRPGYVNEGTGAASYRYIEESIRAVLAGDVDAITTGPIHKEALHDAGVFYPGHTEILAARTGVKRYCMMLTCQQITCSFVTTHVGYREVPKLLSVERILDVIELSADALSRLRQRQAKLAVCALNPHAGERGLFGEGEEERVIEPAIAAARQKGIQVAGPFPPDTAFLPDRRFETDCFVCMYHDQGHIPLKALAFDVAVNVTLGLPIVRTSVDHGTALDIAWQGKAVATSMIEAVKLATCLSAERPVSVLS